MPILIEDQKIRTQLLPFTFTRHIAQIRIGIQTIQEKWANYLKEDCQLLGETYLGLDKISEEPLVINSSILPTPELAEAIKSLAFGTALYHDDQFIAAKFQDPSMSLKMDFSNQSNRIYFPEEVKSIRYRWDIFQLNDYALKLDFEFITDGRNSQIPNNTVSIVGNTQNVFIEEGAKLNCCTLNPLNSYIYVAASAEIMEGANIRGGVALCENSVLKMGAKVYGSSTFGPYVKCGGEISNTVFFGYSNKSHDGYLGNSVIGEWCNLGADSNTSNLKNNYSNVKVWDYGFDDFVRSGQQFVGLMMADHSKCGINTMFNTGTTVGVAFKYIWCRIPI